jgi:hypothetical protein
MSDLNTHVGPGNMMQLPIIFDVYESSARLQASQMKLHVEPLLTRGGRPLLFGKAPISALCSKKKNHSIVLLYVFNRIAFRRVPWRRARDKNATEFRKLAMHCMSCFEQLLAHGHETNERYGTTYQCQSRSPWRGSRGESSLPQR